MIRNLIFDVGDVLLSYRWKDMLIRDYGLDEEEAIRAGKSMFDADIWENGLDIGRITVAEAIEEYRRILPQYSEVISWALNHCELMPVPRPQVWKKMEQLKDMGYKIYLLSNYSKELFEIHTRGASFLNILDGGVISYQVHMLKPEEGIYRALLEKYDLKPEECIFFDDREQNVEAARKMGIQARQILSEETIKQELDSLISKGKLESE